MMNLSCHCGNISITVPAGPENLLSCNCSTCHRYGALWGYYKPSEIVVEIKTEKTGTYRWGDEHLEFMHCSTCGCMTHYVTTEKADKPKVGINFRMADRKEIQDLKIRKFDGADTWKFLD
ncbi:MAG: hypothetical protein ACI9EW_003340 [Cellvibrionaceae bacterium]|jgi:hypothetical protein